MDFIIFDAILGRIIFLISLIVYLLLVHRNTADFYMLILFPATLLYLFISSNGKHEKKKDRQ